MKCLASKNKTEMQKIKKSVIDDSVNVYHIATISVLVEKYGFGNEKMCKILHYLDERAESIKYEYISIVELEDVLKEEYDICFSDYFVHSEYKSKGEVIINSSGSASLRFFIVSVASILTDKFGIGKHKVTQIIKSIMCRANDILSNKISICDIEKLLKEKHDIEIG
jgi:hypothetical protein